MTMASDKKGSSSTKTKEIGIFAKGYLLAYNLAQTAGWSYLLYQSVAHFARGEGIDTLWANIKPTVMLFQNAAVLEVVHVALGLVKSNLVVTAMQVASRVIVVLGVINPTPTAPLSIGLPLLTFAWSVTEIIRYLFYALNLANSLPFALVWCRYSFFWLLYPMGVTGELLCFYSAQLFVQSTKMWTIEMPNAFNATFCYRYLLIIIMLLYIPLFPYLFLHMVQQRKKIIGGASGKKQK